MQQNSNTTNKAVLITVNACYLDYLSRLSSAVLSAIRPPVSKNTLVNSTIRYLDLVLQVFGAHFITLSQLLRYCFENDSKCFFIKGSKSKYILIPRNLFMIMKNEEQIKIKQNLSFRSLSGFFDSFFLNSFCFFFFA